MPIIRPSSDLRNSYNEISNVCHQTKKPIYITKNGTGDLAIMSIEAYEALVEKIELYKELEKGIKSLENDKTFSTKEVFDEIEKILEQEEG